MVGGRLKLGLNIELLFASALEFCGKEGPPRHDKRSDLSFYVGATVDQKCSELLSALPWEFRGCFECIYVYLCGVFEFNLEEIAEQSHLLASIQIGPLGSLRQAGDRA